MDGKQKFNPVRAERLVGAAARGWPMAMVARAGGVHASTLYRWLREGEELVLAGEDPGLLGQFYLDYCEAQLTADELAINRILGEMEKPDGAWTAAAWWLERRYPDEFGRKVRAEHSGPRGGPIRAVTSIEVVERALPVPDEEDVVIESRPRLLGLEDDEDDDEPSQT